MPDEPTWFSTFAPADEPAIEPDLPIIDPHHHLWDHPARGAHPASRYLLPDLLADTGDGHNITQTVFLECGAMYRADGPAELKSLGETEFVIGVAAMSASGRYGPTKVAAGIVGNVDLLLGDRATPVLEAHIAAAGGRFRGVRNSSAWAPFPMFGGTPNPAWKTLLAEPQFRRGFAALAPLGLSFDAWLLHPQMVDLADLARAFPDTTIIMDHLGTPLGVHDHARDPKAAFAEWKAGMAALAACPNVEMKVGGLGMEFLGTPHFRSRAPVTSEMLAPLWAPYVETAIELFGPGRCMLESNYPADAPTCSYRVLWNVLKRLTAGYSTDERALLFGDVARRVYRLGPDAAA